MNAIFIDNFDSFSFNLVDDLRTCGVAVDVWRNDLPAQEALARCLSLAPPRLIVMSPGPGRPEDAGCCVELTRLAAGKVPLFGVCLGLQSMVVAFGGRVDTAGAIVHGKASPVTHDGRGVFAGLPNPLTVGRYHSLVATEVPDALEVPAYYRDLVMAVRHPTLPVLGVQFHPESILTPHGRPLMANVVDWAARAGCNTPDEGERA